MTIGIEPTSDGCELTLVHQTSPQWVEESGDGWKMILDGLTGVVGGV